MRTGFFLACAIAVSSVVAVPLAPVAYAQTSFGNQRPAPQNKDEWTAALSRELTQNLRAANSSLSAAGSASNVSATIAVTVARNGQVVDVAIVEGTGRRELDRGLLRAVSRTTQVAPFTPDMRDATVIYVMQIGTQRG